MVRVKYRYLTLNLSDSFCINNNIDLTNSNNMQKSFIKYLYEELRRRYGIFFMSRFYFHCKQSLLNHKVLVIQVKRDQPEFFDFIKNTNSIKVINIAGSIRTAKVKFLINNIN